MWLSFSLYLHGAALTLSIARICAIPVGGHENRIGNEQFNSQDHPSVDDLYDAWHQSEFGSSSVSPHEEGFLELLSTVAANVDLSWPYDSADTSTGASPDRAASHARPGESGDQHSPAPQVPAFNAHPQQEHVSDLQNSSPTASAHAGSLESTWFDDGAQERLGIRPDRLYRARRIFGGRGKQWRIWQQSIHSVFPNRQLLISPVSIVDYQYDNVLIAQDDDPVQGPYPRLTSEDQQWHFSKELHFLRSDKPGKVEVEQAMTKGQPQERLYMYLNSRGNMDYLNREFFLGHLQFLPLRREGLTRSNMNRLHMKHVQIVTPPSSKDGLPLVIVSHDLRFDITEKVPPNIRHLTGLETPRNLISLWSPVFYDGRRYTTVLHGIASYDSRYALDMKNRLQALAASRDPGTYGSFYDLKTLARLAH